MAPEQASSGLAGPPSDLYALGCVLHEVLTGRPVFNAPTPYALFAKHAMEPPTPVRALRPDVPVVLEQLILGLLAKQPQSRPGSAYEVFSRLVALLPKGSGGDSGDRPFDPFRPFHSPMAPPPRPAAGDRGVSRAVHAAATPERNGAEIDLATTLAEAERLVGQGSYAPAVQILGSALTFAQHKHDPVIRALRKQYAKILMLDGQSGAALTEFDRLARTAAADHGPTSGEALGFRYQAAQCREQSGDLPGALAEYQAILPPYAALPDHDARKALTMRDRIGRLLIATGQPRQAWPVLLGVLQEQERMLGTQHPDNVALRGGCCSRSGGGGRCSEAFSLTPDRNPAPGLPSRTAPTTGPGRRSAPPRPAAAAGCRKCRPAPARGTRPAGTARSGSASAGRGRR